MATENAPNALAKIDNTDGTALYRQATNAAGMCKQIVVRTACGIQGKKYVRVEGWMAIATAHGCILSARDVEAMPTGWKAVGEVRRIHDGAILATAEGFVGKDEKTWQGRAEYACRAMAQTRAMSRAARSAFAHVVVLMDAGLETTPAEEVPSDGFNDQPRGIPTGMKRGTDLKTPPMKQVEAAKPEPDDALKEDDLIAFPSKTFVPLSVEKSSKRKGFLVIKDEDTTEYFTKNQKWGADFVSAKQQKIPILVYFDPGPDGNDIAEYRLQKAVTVPT